ncbi:MAG TPA: hypothetical protein VMG35_14680 [Bryobacteraceae bacterium]|nr:hypothetical protein [Bryobacteraceae bacterium]
MYCPFAKCARQPLGALLAAGLLCLGAACSRTHTIKTADGQLSYQEKGKDGGTISVTGKDGKTATLSFNQNKVPDDYPKDVPIYSPAKVVMSQSASEKNTRNLMLESADAADKIVDFYKKGLDSSGWKTESTVATAQLTMLTATKGQRQVVLQISDNGGQRGIMQVVSDKQ